MSRADNRLAPKAKTRIRQYEFVLGVLSGRRQARADAKQVARANLRENPNRGKYKHPVTGTRVNGPRMSDRHRNEPRKTLSTFNPATPSLPPLLTKNIPAGRMRGEVTDAST